MFFEFLCYHILNTYPIETKEYFETNTKDEDKKQTTQNTSKTSNNNNSGAVGGLLGLFMYLIQFAIFAFAIYTSIKRNKGFALGPFLAACCYPTLYLLYSVAIPITEDDDDD